MHYNKMKLAVGIFVLTFIVTLSTILFFILEKKGTFDKRYTYYFNTPSANSFVVGMPLKFSGFSIAVIDDISLRDDGSVDMRFSVTHENRKWINESSTLTIKKPLIGSAHIEISAKRDAPILPEGTRLQIVISDDINDMIAKLEPIVERVTNIIDNINKITNYLAQDNSDLLQAVVNINRFTKKLADDESLLQTFTGDKEATKGILNFIKESEQFMDSLQKTIDNIELITESLDRKIVTPSSITITELNAILKDIRKKLITLDGTVTSVGALDKDLVEFKEKINITIEKSNHIMDKVDSLLQSDQKSEIELP